MKLYIKTPFVKDNKFIPHLVEHCVNAQPDFKTFLKYQKDTEAWTASGCTGFARDDIAIEDFFAQLQKPLQKSIFDRKMEAISKELKSPSFGQKAYEKILSCISERKIITNKVQKI